MRTRSAIQVKSEKPLTQVVVVERGAWLGSKRVDGPAVDKPAAHGSGDLSEPDGVVPRVASLTPAPALSATISLAS